MRYDYRTIEKASAALMDGGNPNSFAKVLWRPPTPGVWGDVRYRFALGSAQVQNRSGGAANVGIGVRLHPNRWKAGQWTNGSTTFTDDTVDAQSAAASDFPLETLVASDGFCVFGYDLFSVICLNVGTASVGTNPTRVLEYTLAGGTWGSISNALVMPVTGGHFATGEALIWWTPPVDWAVAEAGHGTNVPVGLYGIRIRSTTAPGTTAAVASSMTVASVLGGVAAVADKGFDLLNGRSEYIFPAHGDALVGVISVANSQNIFNADVRVL